MASNPAPIPVVDLVSDHRANLDLYNTLSRVASAGYPSPLNEEQREAYMLLPQLIEDCAVSYALIPDGHVGKPAHYLMYA